MELIFIFFEHYSQWCAVVLFFNENSTYPLFDFRIPWFRNFFVKHFPRYWSFLREFLGHRWIPLPKTSDAELWCFLWSAPEQMVEQTIETPVIWDPIALIMTSLKCLDRFLDMADKTYFFCLSTSTQIHESTWSVLLHFNQLWIFPCRNSSARVANTAGEEVMGSDKCSITNYSSFF